MITVRRRVGPLSTHRLAVRHSVDYSSSYHFISDDSSRDSPSDSSLETSSDSSSDADDVMSGASFTFIIETNEITNDTYEQVYSFNRSKVDISIAFGVNKGGGNLT
ncbi:hypothetical protein Tco_0756771 [Tanacetum coccineum]